MNYYHPDTLEHIRNPLPAVADWAGKTSLPVPAYDPAKEVCRFISGAWVVAASGLPLSELQNKKIAELKAMCQQRCFAGVTSSALGVPYLYDTEQGNGKNDQVNLTAIHSDAVANMATTGWTQKITCTLVSTGVKGRVAHTASQAKQVADAAKAMIEGNLENLWTKIAQVEQATTASEVDVVVW